MNTPESYQGINDKCACRQFVEAARAAPSETKILPCVLLILRTDWMPSLYSTLLLSEPYSRTQWCGDVNCHDELHVAFPFLLWCPMQTIFISVLAFFFSHLEFFMTISLPLSCMLHLALIAFLIRPVQCCDNCIKNLRNLCLMFYMLSVSQVWLIAFLILILVIWVYCSALYFHYLFLICYSVTLWEAVSLHMISPSHICLHYMTVSQHHSFTLFTFF